MLRGKKAFKRNMVRKNVSNYRITEFICRVDSVIPILVHVQPQINVPFCSSSLPTFMNPAGCRRGEGEKDIQCGKIKNHFQPSAGVHTDDRTRTDGREQRTVFTEQHCNIGISSIIFFVVVVHFNSKRNISELLEKKKIHLLYRTDCEC